MVIAPYVLSEGTRSPYVTVEEVLASPTASAIDFSNLIENGSDAVQRRALKELIVRASAKADNYCLGALGTLCASVNTENGRTRPNRLGEFIIHPEFWPILEVQSFAAGPLPGAGMDVATLSANNCEIERHQFVVTNAMGLSRITSIGSLSALGGAYGTNVECFVQYTYVNGFANTFLNANAAAGSTSLVVQSAIGIYAGMTMTIWDGINDESVVVSSSYDNASLTVPLASATQYAHGSGCNFSSLPASVKQAVIHFVVAMVKQRGQGGLVLTEMGQPVAVSGTSVTNASDDAEGKELLDTFKQVWGRN